MKNWYSPVNDLADFARKGKIEAVRVGKENFHLVPLIKKPIRQHFGERREQPGAKQRRSETVILELAEFGTSLNRMWGHQGLLCQGRSSQ